MEKTTLIWRGAEAYGERVVEVIERAALAESTKYQYKKAIRHYLDTGNALTDATALAVYARGLNQSSRAFLKAGVRLLSKESGTVLKSSATPENVSTVQAGLLRLDALNEAIKVQTKAGTKAHTWLTSKQVKKMMAACDEDDIVGRRDWIVLALLVGAGLSRSEVAQLRFDDMKQQRNRTVLQVHGKGAKARLVPISIKLAERIREWEQEVGGGRIARALGRKIELADSLSDVGVFNIVRKHGRSIGKPELAPHDLSRTYAQIGFAAGVSITQISVLLGHANVGTTQRYLNLDLDLDTTASDFIPL